MLSCLLMELISSCKLPSISKCIYTLRTNYNTTWSQITASLLNCWLFTIRAFSKWEECNEVRKSSKQKYKSQQSIDALSLLQITHVFNEDLDMKVFWNKQHIPFHQFHQLIYQRETILEPSCLPSLLRYYSVSILTTILILYLRQKRTFWA